MGPASRFFLPGDKMRKIPSWDDYFYEMAKLVSTKSKDHSTHIGAVIVGQDNEVVSTGYNSFPRGLNDNNDERQERPEKYFWFEHGERNAIYNAARHGAALKGCKMYLSCQFPCTGCARAIIQVGIKEVILGQKTSHSKKWEGEAARSMKMFEESGVKVRLPNESEPISR
jgi:dCMP deaminase